MVTRIPGNKKRYDHSVRKGMKVMKTEQPDGIRIAPSGSKEQQAK